MDVVDKIVEIPTTTRDGFKDSPERDVIIVSARRGLAATQPDRESEAASGGENPRFVAGEHYMVLDEPVPTKDDRKLEVIEAFSYGCANCYGMESLLQEWRLQQSGDVTFRQFHAVWNPAMELYARAFFVAQQLGIAETLHRPLFKAIVVEHRQLQDARALAQFFAQHGVEEQAFLAAFNSAAVTSQIKSAEARTRSYNLASVPEIVVNGRYRVDPMRAGGRSQMLEVVDFLLETERERRSK
jgi:thiol:disulfide interchange protein DsbA